MDSLTVWWEIDDIINQTDDIYAYEFTLSKSESPAGPYDVVFGPFQNIFSFRDSIHPENHKNRTIYYKLLVKDKRNQESREYGPTAQIAQPGGALTSDPVEINLTLKNFYSSLYKTEASDQSEEINHFLRHINFPKVDSLLASELDRSITLEEIIKSINLLQSKKSPGPDGLPSEFYKKFQFQLAPLLLSVYEESLELGMLPPTLRQASITLLLKDGKDPTLCNSYRQMLRF